MDDSEDGNRGKNPIESKGKSVMTNTKISDIFLEIRNQMFQEHQQNEVTGIFGCSSFSALQ